MQRWLFSPVQRAPQRLWFSSQHLPRQIRVPCASSGDITVSLHNVSDSHSTAPLIIWIPPFPREDGVGDSQPPSWLRPYQTAVINYRWSGLYPDSSPFPSTNAVTPAAAKKQQPLYWPAPIHDLLFGYSWILRNLAPPNFGRRDFYVCGSYLGASLAASLAMTESHAHQPTAVRGIIAYNGIYNWTTFLPDHPVNESAFDGGDGSLSSAASAESNGDYEKETMFDYLEQQAPALFPSPADLFDPFASASLFFHSPELLVPADFHQRSQASAITLAVDALASVGDTSDGNSSSANDSDSAGRESTMLLGKVPRKGYFAFPPRDSTLKIPETLLLHETPPPASSAPFRHPWGSSSRSRGGKRDIMAMLGVAAAPPKRKKVGSAYYGGNSFGAQAAELAGLMRRSIDKIELKQRMRWDNDLDGWDTEAERRVQVAEVGEAALDGDAGLGARGEEVAAGWLEERIEG
ncbi:hypothetical protein B0T17DRAFT_505659 [Bombardia bombarda]|uniref:Alpha/beta-hydrolase n=1 Tax=Bombardia bombarda TaxID=252184 RepID=A0AA39X830_9PEZI|nr:hypothetical protein B0T17DRAFT_505659 [Bombardia bombarda]